MATTTSIANMQPLLESVLGPMTNAEDKECRAILAEVDNKLLALARYFGQERAGWEGTGLELTWLPSGQVEINSFVEVWLHDSKCVSFLIELRPTWFYGERTGNSEWEIEAEIYADSPEEVKQSAMARVHGFPVLRAMTPKDAVIALSKATDDLIRLAHDTPLEEWITKRDSRSAQ